MAGAPLPSTTSPSSPPSWCSRSSPSGSTRKRSPRPIPRPNTDCRPSPMTLHDAIEITPELVADHGLKPDEYDKILGLIGRVPTFTELGIFSAMWNEHCSYKSSKKWLKTLPTKG